MLGCLTRIDPALVSRMVSQQFDIAFRRTQDQHHVIGLRIDVRLLEGTLDRTADHRLKAGQPFDEKTYHDRICKYEGQWWRERLGTFNAEPQGDGIALAKAIAEKYRSELEARYRK